MVLFLFVVMLLNAPHEDAAEWDRTHPLQPAVAACASARCSAVAARRASWSGRCRHVEHAAAGRRSPTPRRLVSSVREIGRVLFTDYAFAFEVTSVLILVAMVGAVVLARQDAE